MNPPPPPPLAPTHALRPVDTAERLVLLDVLRGFALCGVFVSNVLVWFSGRVFLPPARIEAAMANASLLDAATQHLSGFFIFGKFITLFSFLFGLGFAIQMGRAEASGRSVVPIYVRRLAVLLIIGLSHLFLLWYGDILSTYAVLGFGLLLFRNRTDRTLLLWVIVLILVAPVITTLLLRLPQLLSPPEVAAAIAKERNARMAALKADTLAAFTNGGYLDVLRAGARYYASDFLRSLGTVLLALFGRFLLGFVAGRRRLFHDAAQHLPLFRRLLGWGLVIGGLGSGAALAVQLLTMRKVINPDGLPWLPMVLTPVRQISEIGLAAVYASALTLLFQRGWWQRLLSVLAPVGRMALTNYLAQTVISLFLFYGYGLGLIGRLGPAACAALALGIFSLQILWSHLWMGRFRFGPAEWLWRSLTYGKAQPMRLPPRTEEPPTAP